MTKPLFSSRALELLRWLEDKRWLRPMDIGARDGSYHSAMLSRLARLGYVERKKIHSMVCPRPIEIDNGKAARCSCKGSCLYRRSKAGRKAARAILFIDDVMDGE